MELRRLTIDDLDGYFVHRLLALKNSPTAFLTTYDEEKARGNSHFAKTLSENSNGRAIFAALQDSALIGSVGIYMDERQRLQHKSWIWGMYVDPDHRDKGIGGKLLDLAINFAKKQMNVQFIGLSVDAGNINAKQLYLSRGFKTWGIEPKAMVSGNRYFDEDHMILSL